MEIHHTNKIHKINTIKNPPQNPAHKIYNHNNTHTKQQLNTTTPPSKHSKHQYTNTHPTTPHKNPTKCKITIKTKKTKPKQTQPTSLTLNQV